MLTNPPFGTKGANQAPDRDDFTIATSNKQLNFLQHVLTILKPGGRAAVVLPDNCLFADQAGEVFEILMQDCNLHTVLRLPRGTFTPYSQGVKTNVVFFTKGRPTERVWIYDARTNVPGITKKDRPLTAEHFAEFEKCYGADPNGRSKRSRERLGRGPLAQLHDRRGQERTTTSSTASSGSGTTLDDPDDLPEPEELITEAMEELQLALDDLADIQRLLEGNGSEPR